MNKKIYLLPILLLALVFTSCEETKEVSRYDNWQARNEAFIDSLYNVYTTEADHDGFARVIDERIVTEMISCYPNVTDLECACCWKFTLR